MSVWDPADQIITSETFAGEIAAVEKKFKAYEERPGRIRAVQDRLKKVLFGCGLVTVVLIFFGLFQIGLVLMFIAAAALGMYRLYISGIQTDMVNLLIAKKNGWIYNPAESRGRWGYLGVKFPQIFQVGSYGEQIEDQFWGSMDVKGKRADFWTGVFKFEIRSGKSSITIRKTVVGVRAPEPARYPLYVQANDLFGPNGGLFLAPVPATENIAFNKAFSAYAQSTDPAAVSEAVRLVSPAVQERLLDFKKQYGPFTFLVQDDAIFFSFSQVMLKAKHTDFFKSVSLDDRDQADIQNFLQGLFSFIGDMMRFLD